MYVLKIRIRTIVILVILFLFCAAIAIALVLPFSLNMLLFGFDSSSATAVLVEAETKDPKSTISYYTDDQSEITALFDLLSDYNISFLWPSDRIRMKNVCYKITFLEETKEPILLSLSDTGEILLPKGLIVHISNKQSLKPLASFIANWEEISEG